MVTDKKLIFSETSSGATFFTSATCIMLICMYPQQHRVGKRRESRVNSDIWIIRTQWVQFYHRRDSLGVTEIETLSLVMTLWDRDGLETPTLHELSVVS